MNSLVCPGSLKIDVNFIEFKNKAYTEPDQIVNIFSLYFSNIGGQISDSVKQDKETNKIIHFEELIRNKTMYIRPTNEKKISEILENLNKHSAPGQDNITIKEIQIIKKLIVPYLVVLINNIFLTGIFPDILKTGKIRHIYKSGDKSDIQNYRPITITDYLSK